MLTAGCVSPSFTRTPLDPSFVLNPFAPGDRATPIWDLSQVDSVPMAHVQVRPRYPLELRRAGISGNALVDFVVDERGRPRDVHAISATDGKFAESAVRSVAQWQFAPGLKGGQVVRTRMQVPIMYSLNNET